MTDADPADLLKSVYSASHFTALEGDLSANIGKTVIVRGWHGKPEEGIIEEPKRLRFKLRRKDGRGWRWCRWDHIMEVKND